MTVVVIVVVWAVLSVLVAAAFAFGAQVGQRRGFIDGERHGRAAERRAFMGDDR